MKRLPYVVAVMTAWFLVMVVPASSHWDPPNCQGNNPGLNVSRDKTLIRNGDVITYRVEVSNVSTPQSSACEISDATVSLTLPAPDGTPTGQKVVLRTGLSLPAGTGLTGFDPVSWTVAVNPGVVDAVAKADVTGVLHDTTETDHMAAVTKTLGTNVTAPHTLLTVVANPNSGRAPLTVAFTYTETNDGDTPISGVKPTDDLCDPVALQGGDANGNGILDVREVWTFTCTRAFNEAGTFTSHVSIKGRDPRDGRGVPDEQASATVTVSAPPPPPPPPSPAPAPRVLAELTPPVELPRTL